jgi:hypothetical protein
MKKIQKRLNYLLAETWLSKNDVKEEYREELLSIVEKVFDFVEEYGKIRGKIKLGLKDLDEIDKLRKKFFDFYHTIMFQTNFREDPYLSAILKKLFEDAKKILDKPLFS